MVLGKIIKQNYFVAHIFPFQPQRLDRSCSTHFSEQYQPHKRDGALVQISINVIAHLVSNLLFVFYLQA